MHSRFLLSALLLLATTATSLAQPAARLDGTWLAVAAERDGKSAADAVGHTLTFSSGKFAIQRDGKTLYAGTYTADPNKKPSQIDFRNTTGGLKGTWRGIYEITGDTLKTCDNAPNMSKPRPTVFSAPAGSGHISIVFRRNNR